METLNAAWTWLGNEIAAFGVRWLFIGALAVLGTLIFGPRYKQRIAALEAETVALKAKPTISQTFNYHVGQPLRDAASTATMQSLEETMRRLPQNPLGDGHVCAELPPGTNIVSIANGEYRLALPIQVEVSESIGISDSVEVKLIKGGDT